MMLVMVNGVEITDDEIHAEMQYHVAGSLESARHKSAQALVVRRLLIQEAVKKGFLDVEGSEWEKEEESIDRLIGEEVSVPEADEESCRRYYEKNEDRFMDKKTRKLCTFEDVEPYIRDYLRACSLSMGICHYVRDLVVRSRIEGCEMEGIDDSLLR